MVSNVGHLCVSYAEIESFLLVHCVYHTLESSPLGQTNTRVYVYMNICSCYVYGISGVYTHIE